jgi:hypothetical protein
MPKVATKQREVLRLLLLGLQINDIAKELSMTTKKVYKARGELARKGFLTKQQDGIYTESTGQQHGGNTSLILPTKGELFPPSRNNWVRYHNIQVTIGILKSPNDWLSKQNSIFFRNADKNFGMTKYIDLTKEEITGRIYRKTIVIQLPEITKPTIEEAEAEAVVMIKRNCSLIEQRYQLILIKDGYLNFKLNKGHYALIHNELAKTYKDKKEKLNIYYQDGKLRLTIDFSKNKVEGIHTPELEATHPQQAPNDIRNIKQFWDEFLENPFMPKDFWMMSEQQKLVLGVQAEYTEQIKKHLLVMDNINKSLSAIRSLAAKQGKGITTDSKSHYSPSLPNHTLERWI